MSFSCFEWFMGTALLNFIERSFSLGWLTGPVFDKELRVSSRRRRNYVLRFAYLALLTCFLTLVWIQVMMFSGSGLYRMSRMAEAGKQIVAYVVWFQFIATQIVAVVMLSTSISDEIYHRTLGLLMTTPVNSFQIVMGKLFSKLLQLILLLAISLPLLAVVRVFGGVPWSYVVSSLCITLSTAIFLGSLSLFFSIFTRRAYVAIILTCVTAGAIFGLVPLIGFMAWHFLELRPIISEKILWTIFLLPNPYCNLFFNTIMMVEPRAAGGGMPSFFWPLHCGLMLVASGVLLSVCVVKVRKVALRQVVGHVEASSRRRRPNKNASSTQIAQEDAAVRSRPVTGPPMLWRELRFPLFGRRKTLLLVTIAICIGVLALTYLLCAAEGILDDEEVQITYAVIFLGIGVLFSTVLSSTCITSEKEARSWPLLMATTLDDGEILLGKFVGIVRRCLFPWLLLLGHVLLFSLAGIIHPVAVFQTTLLVIWIVGFLAGTGLYFGSCFKHTTTAVLMNFALAAVIWGVLPFVLALLAAIFGPVAEVYMDTNPFVHAVVILEAAVGNPGTYRWVGFHGSQISGTVASTIWMLICMAGYLFLGFLFAMRAKRRFRRNVF